MKFGDVIFNGWASKDNPTRVGIFVKKKGKHLVLTDGKGKFWELASLERKRVIGNVLIDGVKLTDFEYEDEWETEE